MFLLFESVSRWGQTVCLSWRRWGWPTGSAACTPDTACSSSSASWRRRSRLWGVRSVRGRCSRSSAGTDRWDTGPGTTPADATPPTRCAPDQGWWEEEPTRCAPDRGQVEVVVVASEGDRWGKTGEAPGSRWRRSRRKRAGSQESRASAERRRMRRKAGRRWGDPGS